MARDRRPRDSSFEIGGGAPVAALNAEIAACKTDFVILRYGNSSPVGDLATLAAEAFAESRDLAAVYFDEMKVTTSPSLYLEKPRFDEDMLLAVDYVGPHLAIRRDALAALGGLPEDRPGTELRHLVLAAARERGMGAVGHLPAAVTRQVADGRSGKREARRQCSADHLALKGIEAACTLEELTGIVHVQRVLPDPPPRASIIIPTRDRIDLLRPCVESLMDRTDYRDYAVVIIDNGSTERETLDYLAELSSRSNIFVVREEGPFNFSALNNAAARQANGRILVFLNNDTEVRGGDWLRELVVHAIRPEIGAVGAKLLYPDGRIQHGGIILGGPAMARHAYRFFPGDHAGYMHRLRVPHRADAVTAACLAVSAEKFRAVGGFDETVFPVAYNDVDLCLKLEQAGYINLWTPYATLIHKESATRGHGASRAEAEAFAGKWRDRLAAAPVSPLDA